MNEKQIHDFAIKWLEKYKAPKIIDREVEENFAEECFALGFEMDCGSSLKEAYLDKNVLDDYVQFKAVIDQISDVKFLGTAILSKWRGITHWSYNESLLSERNRPWFIIAFERLAYLAETNDVYPLPFQGEAKKIRIISNNVSYGPAPSPDEEVEQRLTLSSDGRVWFSGYNFDYGIDHYTIGRKFQFKLDQEKVDIIFAVFSRFFAGNFEDVFATDIGSWEMTITNEDGRTFEFAGSLCAQYEIDGMDLSDLLREELGIENLFAFDGNDKPDAVNRITIDYNRHKKIKLNAPLGENVEGVVWDYSERIEIDRALEKLTYRQNIGSDCIVTREYQVKGGIADLLDRFDADDLFSYTEGSPDDAIENPIESRNYSITIDFKKGSQRIVTGSFDKKGLPEDWPELAEEIYSFISFYGHGEVLNPYNYKKTKRREGDYIICSVAFENNGKNYYYLAKDDVYKVGDFVFVPSSVDGDMTTVRIEKIEYFNEESVPYPVAKMKHIIRKCKEDGVAVH